MNMQRTPSTRRGLSLLELLIVTLVIGIMAAAASTRYAQSLDFYRADSAARRIAADLEYAASEAQRTSRPRQVTFNTATDDYTLLLITELDDDGQTYAVDLASEFNVDLTTADFSGSSTASFDMYGRPVNAGSIAFQTNGEARTVTLNADGSTSIP